MVPKIEQFSSVGSVGVYKKLFLCSELNDSCNQRTRMLKYVIFHTYIFKKIYNVDNLNFIVLSVQLFIKLPTRLSGCF